MSARRFPRWSAIVNTQIHTAVQTNHGTRYTLRRQAVAPSDIRDMILHVDGLHDCALVKAAIATTKSAKKSQPPSRSTLDMLRRQNVVRQVVSGPIYGPVSGGSGFAGYSPAFFATNYDFRALHGDTGTGRASGIVIDADYNETDLNAFLSYFNIRRTGPATTRVLIDGGPPPVTTLPDGSWNWDSAETTLDVTPAVSQAPGTALYVYEFPNFDKTTSTANFRSRRNSQPLSPTCIGAARTAGAICEVGRPSDIGLRLR